MDGAIRADLANAELLATFFQIGHGLVPGAPRLDVRSIASEVSERIGDEIDYLTEARHQQEFADHYRGHPFVRVPEVVHELTTRRVLTMDFVEGIRHRDALEAVRTSRTAGARCCTGSTSAASAASACSTPTRTRATTCSTRTGP